MPFDGNEFPVVDKRRSRFGRRLAKEVCRWLSGRTDGRRSSRGATSLSETLPPSEPPAFKPGSPSMETLILLTVARALVADEKKWTRGKYETLIGGRRCAMGAICVAADILRTSSVIVAIEDLTAVARRLGFPSVEAMNDASSHSLMLKGFDEAIGLAASRLAALRRREHSGRSSGPDEAVSLMRAFVAPVAA